MSGAPPDLEKSSEPRLAAPKNLPPVQEFKASGRKAVEKQQNDRVLAVIQETLKAEDAREKRVARATTSGERRKLEKTFEVERQKERERIERITNENQILLAQLDKTSSNGALPRATKDKAPSTHRKLPTLKEDTAAAFSNNQHRVATEKNGERSRPATQGRPPPSVSSPTSSVRGVSNASAHPSFSTARRSLNANEVAFLKEMYQKDQHASGGIRGHATSGVPKLDFQTLANHEKSQRQGLLRQKAQLLRDLKQLVVQEEKALVDGGLTVRSSVSSWHSSHFDGASKRPDTASTYQYWKDC